MAQRSWGLLAGLLLVCAVSAQAADEFPAGNYKVSIVEPGQQQGTHWLVKLTSKDGKWTGEVVPRDEGIPETALRDLEVKEGQLGFTLKITGFPPAITFEGKLPPEGKKILGTLDLGRPLATELELTTLKTLEPLEVARDTLSRSNASGPEVINAALTLIGHAAEEKAKGDEVRSWASKALKTSEGYGRRLQLETAIRVADSLAKQDGYGAEAAQYARQAERLLTPTDKKATQRRVLTSLVAALKKAGKDEDAKEAEGKLEKLATLTPVKYPGRKGKGDETVVVELFTGAECPPCVAADIAFDGLAKTYSPKDVILLQYHLHVPGPDPLTSPVSEERAGYYRVEGTPSLYFNGRRGAPGGGKAPDAAEKYDEYMDLINALLEEEAKAEVKVSAAQKGNKIEITGTVDKLATPSDKMKLRFALVEEEIKYKGGNKQESHHFVVRDFPGGVEGFALKDKTTKQTATVDLEELRKKLKSYLEAQEKENGPFPNKDRPLDLKKLRVVALVQNDATREILQAAQVEIKDEKGE